MKLKKFLTGANSYIDSDTININVGSRSALTSTASFATTSGVKYTYEFWKPTNKGYVVGSGEVSY